MTWFMIRPIAIWLLVLTSCNFGDYEIEHPEWSPPGGPAVATEILPREPCLDRSETKQALFGDLHVHTGFSADANARNVVNRPADAYRYARGEEIFVPPLGADGLGTRGLKIDRPLDFAAVTDHAEWLGEVSLCQTPGSVAYETRDCRIFRGEQDSWIAWFFGLEGWPARAVGVINLEGRGATICGEDGSACRAAAKSRWQETQEAAEEFYDRSAACNFTTLVGWEYSRSPGQTKIHRNVFFRNNVVPEMPLSWVDSATEVVLWEKLVDRCLDTGTGCDALTIPHNPNLSGGHIFTLDYQSLSLAEQKRRVALRARLEPVVEMMQIKGESECRNNLWQVLGGADELCDFEKFRGLGELSPENCEGDERSRGAMRGKGCVQRLDYVRYAIIEGMREEDRLGINPFEVGFIGSTDTHNAAPGAVEEKSYPGTSGTMDDTAAKRLATNPDAGVQNRSLARNPGGLAGVWAEENSREAIFDALRRRETFATSGPRIRPRFFAGWNLPPDLCENPSFAEIGYKHGVPMGGTLTSPPASGGAPTFVVQALADSGTTTNPGNLLQRIQIVKGWYGSDDTFHQSVHEVAGSAENGATVDTASCSVSGPGHRELCGGWRDPDFDPGQRAVYYARILENPSCRWNAWQCLEFAAADRPSACDNPDFTEVIQERAWTSPVWYVPPRT